ncbi:major facilitator superfamily domain-containing protein [Bisporella sp. PMI_857]|nr:major facilitator superfamily domain-containing protein [Bisporella sp. PMI_857]
MDNCRDDNADTVTPTDYDGRPWGAQDSLRRNAGFNAKPAESEVTPLLGNGDSASGPDGTAEDTWDGANDFVGLPWWRRPSLFWLLPAFAVFALAFGTIIVPKLNLILSLVCREYLFDKSQTDPTFIFTPVLLAADNPQCRIPEVQALVSKFTLWLTIIPGILSAIVAPKIGALSDRYGRKKFMIVSSSGLFITEVITIVVAKYPDTLHYRWLLVGALFDGFSGSFTVNMALTHAYAADITAPPKRSVAFGYFHACLFSGIAIGPLFAAFLIKVFGHILVIFYVALGTYTFFIFYVLFLLPESLSIKRQVLARERYTADGENALSAVNLSTWGYKRLNILEPLKILWPTGPGSSEHLRANLVLLSVVDTIIFGVAMGSAAVVILYMGYQFGWNTAQTSAFISVVNITRVSCLLIILPLLNYIFRTRRANRQRRESGFAIPERNSGSDILDLSIIRTAIFLETLGFIGYAVVRTGPLFVLAGILTACGGIGSPTLQSALTKHVPHDKVGQLLGATGLLHALARVIAPAMFNLVYASTVGTFPQAVFVLLGSCFGLAFVVSWFIRPRVYLEDINQAAANTPREGEERETLVGEEIGGY